MSWQAQKFAWRQVIRPASAKFVPLAYANYANDDGYSWPAQDRIASDTGLDVKTVAGAIDVILVRRVLSRAKTRFGKTGRVLCLRFPKSCRVIPPKTVELERAANPPVILQQSSSNPTSLGSATPNRVTSNHITRLIAAKAGERATASQTPARDYSLSGEKDLLDSLARMLGSSEMKNNGGMWRMRIRSGKDYRKALRNALEDFNVKTPDQQAKVHNRGGWLTNRFGRCLEEIERANSG